jgi:hypothetical protein
MERPKPDVAFGGAPRPAGGIEKIIVPVVDESIGLIISIQVCYRSSHKVDIISMSLHQLRQSLKTRGVFGTIKRIGLQAQDFLRWSLDAGFDRKHNVQTSGKMPLNMMQIKSANLSDATWYEPVSTLAFKQLMKELKIDFEDYYFIDFGSGKGRALFLASDFPFKKIIGVEFSPVLHNACLSNIKSYRSPRQRCFELESVNGDVVDFVMPPIKSVYFFYSPFKASVFSKVIDNLRLSLAGHPRSVYLLFVGYFPEGIQVLKNSGLSCREIKLGPDYIRWEKKRGLILHSGVDASPPSLGL